MSGKPITIRDVALLAGVSESTVSRVLSGAETPITISDETRARVVQAAKELGYRPHPSARALRGKGSNLIGLIVREIDDPFFAQLIEVISNVAKERGYDLVLGYAKADPEEALALSQMFDLRYCDGLFLLGDLQEPPEGETLLARMGGEYLLVTLCRGSAELVGDHPSVGVDNRRGALLALEHLAHLGHRRIAFIAADRLGDLRERQATYLDFMRERFGAVDSAYVQSAANSFAGGYQAMLALSALPQPPTAVFAVDDTMAIGALKAAADRGWAVPGKVSVVGFDDVKIAAYLHPALTTVRQPIEEIGRRALELLLTMVREKAVPQPAPHLLIEPELVVRETCAAPGEA